MARLAAVSVSVAAVSSVFIMMMMAMLLSAVMLLGVVLVGWLLVVALLACRTLLAVITTVVVTLLVAGVLVIGGGPIGIGVTPPRRRRRGPSRVPSRAGRRRRPARWHGLATCAGWRHEVRVKMRGKGVRPIARVVNATTSAVSIAEGGTAVGSACMVRFGPDCLYISIV
ncbi:hypothetical protein ASPZODRAFT_1083190 [Penicilliopsis zonata CBS 506.65]|uniref:Uncharacterized protein n=1 Tax=Penicilliopsis zonata CBS 506.65 TaxID=1073090 RepID=A0A1L9SS00_9EURO|nr:hypothetical protein ASPZODRAFT_1083190 [Penicilliopsis zonata CBS 506.65]OJJ49985.1 hypothetical protein ASPZODRAFT_1083190 [Penicilliopsis zonata CBS 506.65]